MHFVVAYAVTHILVAMVILSLLRHYVFGVKKFPRYLVLIGGIAAILPDAYIVIGWVASWLFGSVLDLHGTFTHSFFIPILFSAIGFAFYLGRMMRGAQVWFVVAFGWLSHVLLDVLYRESVGKALGWPFIYDVGIHARWNLYPYAVHIDAVLLIVWLIHEEFAGNIKDYF